MHVWKVGELTEYLSEVLSREQGLQDLWVEGEVAEVTVSNQGHCYLTLKDDRSRLACVLFRADLARVPFEVRPGLMLTAHGRAAVYAPAGRLQLILDLAQPSGVGGLYLAFEQLRLKLEAEGLFEPSRKRTPPPFPRRVAVVTSESGAALRDVLRVLRRRSPMVATLLVHSPVQGDIAPRSIERALGQAAARQVDVILLVRGGGSIEDLAAFNDERVARAIRACPVPVIVGVGHETDFTIADFAADVRAPTPSAAAAMAAPDAGELRRSLLALRQRLDGAALRPLELRRGELDVLASRLRRVSPERILPALRQRLDDRTERLAQAIRTTLQRQRERVSGAQQRLRALSPMAVLRRGYSLVRNEQGRVVMGIDGLRVDAQVEAVFADGSARARVLQLIANLASAGESDEGDDQRSTGARAGSGG